MRSRITMRIQFFLCCEESALNRRLNKINQLHSFTMQWAHDRIPENNVLYTYIQVECDSPIEFMQTLYQYFCRHLIEILDETRIDDEKKR